VSGWTEHAASMGVDGGLVGNEAEQTAYLMISSAGK
jgi:hypothetical protein